MYFIYPQINIKKLYRDNKTRWRFCLITSKLCLIQRNALRQSVSCIIPILFPHDQVHKDICPNVSITVVSQMSWKKRPNKSKTVVSENELISTCKVRIWHFLGWNKAKKALFKWKSIFLMNISSVTYVIIYCIHYLKLLKITFSYWNIAKNIGQSIN